MIKRLGSSAFRRLSGVLILTTTLVCSLQAGAGAMIAPASVPASAAPESGADRATDMRTVRKTLESKVLRQRLHELGLTDQEIQTRLDRLSDVQVHQLASRIHSVNPGGDVSVIGVLVLVVLVLFIIYLVKRI